jgi:DNA-binding MarR family transcriptional regulator
MYGSRLRCVASGFNRLHPHRAALIAVFRDLAGALLRHEVQALTGNRAGALSVAGSKASGRTRSGGQLKFHIDSLYPLLYRLEERGWIKGTWVEKAAERRRRFYKLTPEGRRVLARQRETWEAFVEAVRRVTGGEHA